MDVFTNTLSPHDLNSLFKIQSDKRLFMYGVLDSNNPTVNPSIVSGMEGFSIAAKDTDINNVRLADLNSIDLNELLNHLIDENVVEFNGEAISHPSLEKGINVRYLVDSKFYEHTHTHTR